jgi:hypothetical protein
MMLIGVDRGIADCVFVDGNGVIRRRHYFADQLTPLWLSLSPKSTWPQISQLDIIEIEKEEREAKAARKAGRRAARKSRRSNKTKRRADASP